MQRYAPKAYHEPAFVPDGYVDVLDALAIVGVAIYGDEWTAKELGARRPAQRQEESRQAYTQILLRDA